jgi:hypothetical protein
MNDPGIFRRDLVRRLILIPTLLLRDFKRVIPPRTGLLRLAHSSPFSRFLVNLSKEGISVKRSIPGHSWRQIRGNKFPRTDWKSDLVQLVHNYIHLSIISHAWFFCYKHISTISYQNTAQTFLYCNRSQFHSL